MDIWKQKMNYFLTFKQEFIRLAAKNIEDRKTRLISELKELQNFCTHPDVEKKYASNTGNYDPSADFYWIEFRCPDCGKFWSKDG